MRLHFTHKRTGTRARAQQRGIALIVVMMLLLLLTALAMTMYVTVNSDMLINGYYRNFRGAFYGADSGLNIMRQELANHIMPQIPPSFDPTPQPLPAGIENAVRTELNAAYGGATYTPITTGQANSWPAKFQVSFTNSPGFAANGLQLVSCSTSNGSPCSAPINTTKNQLQSYTYIYNYHMV